MHLLQFISIKDKGNIGKVLRNWPRPEDARIAVVTDGMFSLHSCDACPLNAHPQVLVFWDLVTLASTACPFPLASSPSTSQEQGEFHLHSEHPVCLRMVAQYPTIIHSADLP